MKKLQFQPFFPIGQTHQISSLLYNFNNSFPFLNFSKIESENYTTLLLLTEAFWMIRYTSRFKGKECFRSKALFNGLIISLRSSFAWIWYECMQGRRQLCTKKTYDNG